MLLLASGHRLQDTRIIKNECRCWMQHSEEAVSVIQLSQTNRKCLCEILEEERSEKSFIIIGANHQKSEVTFALCQETCFPHRVPASKGYSQRVPKLTIWESTWRTAHFASLKRYIDSSTTGRLFWPLNAIQFGQ